MTTPVLTQPQVEWKTINMDSTTAREWGLESKMATIGTEGIVEAIVAVTGNVDSGGDVIIPGAFKAISDLPWIVLGHQFTEEKLLGRTIEFEELLPGDPRLPDGLKQAGLGALWIKAAFNLAKQIAAETWADIQFHKKLGWSIGYFTLDTDTPTTPEERNAGIKRYLKLLDVLEASPVIVGMNRLAHTLAMKGHTMDPIIAGKIAELDTTQPDTGPTDGQKVRVPLTGSYEETREKVYAAVETWGEATFGVDDETKRPNAWVWVAGTFPDRVIAQVEHRKDGTMTFWQMPYVIADGAASLGDAVEVQVAASVTPKGATTPSVDTKSPPTEADTDPVGAAAGDEPEPESKSATVELSEDDIAEFLTS